MCTVRGGIETRQSGERGRGMTDFVNSHFMPVICNQDVCERWTCVQVNPGKLCALRLKADLEAANEKITNQKTEIKGLKEKIEPIQINSDQIYVELDVLNKITKAMAEQIAWLQHDGKCSFEILNKYRAKAEKGETR